MQQTLKKIEEKNKTIEELKQKLSIQSDESKISTQINGNNIAAPGTRFSLLGKIKSFKDNLEQCKAVEHSYNSDSKNQQIQ